ncbi:MAG: hypothetical protein JEZ08_16615 [Clostridiales bacterium]|nr:hypothetical protein [Clostridiales bacterium]
MKKVISLLLVFAIMITYIPFYSVESYADTTLYEDTEYSTSDINIYVEDNFGGTVEPFKTIKGFDLYFNVELHKEKAILVYGNYKDVLKIEQKNDFKIIENGYYTNASYHGEYRNHGYTDGGILYYSNDFPRDSDSGRSVSEKEWIYNYWEVINEEPSDITQDATKITFPNYIPVREKIDDMINDVLKNSTIDSTDPKYKDHEQQGYAVADHMNVNTLNSTLFNGEGKMMQENAGRLWYQMFSTEKANDKNSKDQGVTVEILEKGSYQVNQSGQAVIKVKVTGIYKDADLLSDADKVLYYHEGEMKGINLSLSIGSKTLNYTSRPNTKVNGHNALEHTFEITIDEGDITEGAITASGESYTEFYTPSGTAINNKASAMDIDSIGGGLKSLFDVKDVQLIPDPSNPSKTLPFTESMLEYVDYSIGDIDKYEIKVTNISTNRQETFTYGSNPSAFTHDLYEFVLLDDEYAAYEVKQDVSNAYALDSYTDHFSFRKEVKQAIELDFDIPHHVIDIDAIEASDNTNYGGMRVKSKSIKIDGNDVDWDTFFNGNFVFGPTHSNYLALIEISVISDQDVESIFKEAFNVHSSLPRTKLVAEGSFKENRKVSLYNRSSEVEDPFVTAKYPNEYTITYSAVDGSMTDWKMKTINADHIDMLFKKSGFYKATIHATNGTGRTSSTDYNIGIVPDFEPNVYFNIWNNVLTRNETLNITYSADSLDGDNISSNNFKVYFDEDEDGTAEKLVFETLDTTLPFTPIKLGFYKIVNSLEESFGEETISEFITEADIKKKVVERVFYVDNLRPLVEIDLDVPENFQKIDMYIMSDENLGDADITKLREGRIDYNNDLRLFGLDVKAEYRDLKTYIQSQSINTSYYYGGSYPPSTRSYSSGGFTGTLTRYNVTNNSYEDYYTTTESYRSCSTENVFNGYVNCDSGCLSSCRGGNYGNNCEGSCCDSDYTQRESCSTEYTTVRHYYTVNRYTGYFSGTVYKSIKQEYINPFRETSDKYVIYVADSTFNLADFNEMLLKADFEVILIGNEALRDSVSDEMLFIENDGSDMDVLIRKATDAIGERYPFSSKYLVQVDDTFTLNQIMFDTEGDPLTNHGYQYVQEEVYDNPTGLESYARSTYLADSTGFSNYQATSFSKVGLFKIYALLKDNTGQLNYDKDSNVSEISVLVHRKPIADYVLDWTYNTTDTKYDVTFVDKSYDLDHQISDAQRGIRDFKAMYRLQGASSWIYAIPTSLTQGTYEFRYSVKDMEGAWSDPKTTTFTLSNIPPPQFLDAKLKATKDSEFALSAIPASEDITYYDVKTRYPYDHNLTYGIYNNAGTLVTSISSQSYNSSVDTRVVQDTTWSTKQYNIPSTLADGNYYARVNAVPTALPSNIAYREFPITVVTPINLVSDLTNLTGSEPNTIEATTSIYANDVDVELFRGTANATTLNMTEISNDGTSKTWSVSYVAPNEATLAAGNYYARFTARTPNGNLENLDIGFDFDHLKIESVRIYGDWNHWRGQMDKITGQFLATNPHRFLAHENIHIEANVIGKPDSVTITMSPELTATVYTNKQGHTYRHDADFGLPIESFPLYMFSNNEYNFAREYILPLADWTLGYDEVRRRGRYWITVTAIKGATVKTFIVTDIELTGNIHDLIYYQPEE